MNVPNIGQGLGSVTTFPPTLAGSESAAPGTDVPKVDPAPSNAAQTSRAVDAYQRYGQAPTYGVELVTIPG